MITPSYFKSLAITAFLSATSFLAAEDVTLVAHDLSWLDASVWSNGEVPSAGNNYFLADLGDNPSLVRTTPAGQQGDAEDVNFPGNSLTIPTGSNLLMKQRDQNRAFIRNGDGNVILDGGDITFAPSTTGSTPFFESSSLQITDTPGSSILLGQNMSRARFLTTLTGTGDLLISFLPSNSSTGRSVSISDIGDYTGKITVEKGMVFDVLTDSFFPGGLELTDTAKLTVDKVLRFPEGTLVDPENGVVPEGAYTGTSLDALGSHYENDGGTIIVIDPFVVTTANDEDDGSLDPTQGQGVSLREAIKYNPSGSMIIFDLLLDDEVIELDAALGELLIDKSLTIDASALPNGIVIDGGSDGDLEKDSDETRCFFISDNDDDSQLEVSLNNLTIQNGVFEGQFAGANIHNRENLNLTNCQILDGRAIGAGADGGGIFSGSTSLTMTSCTVSGNQTQGSNANGGGIFSIDGNVTMTSCTVSGNQTQGFFSPGGGIRSIGGNLTMTSCTVSGNQTQGIFSEGGGIFSSFGSLTLTSCTVSGNQTQGSDADGGGIFTVTNLTDETARLTRCTIAGNSALNAEGGGVFNARGLTIIEHCTIVGNSTGNGNGAGVSSDDDTSTRTQISHSIVQDNLGGFDLALQDSGVVNSFVLTDENLIGTVETGIDGVTLNTAAILLAPLANYGGLTETMPPLFGSPAIDAALSSTATEDQRGLLLIDTPDLGAAEFFSSIVTTLDDELDAVATDGAGLSLREALRDAAPGETIFFEPSLDGGTIQLDASLGQLRINKSLFIDASNLPDGIVIHGGSDGDFSHNAATETRCLFIRDEGDLIDLNVTLNHLTIRNGAPQNGNGANLRNFENLTLVDCQILDGRALGTEANGGGIANEGGNLELIRCLIAGNETEEANFPEQANAFGGGIFNRNGDLTLSDCTVSGNRTVGFACRGGGIFSNNGSLTMTNCTVSNNSGSGFSTQGGGIFTNTNLTNQTTRLTRCTIFGNHVFSGGGGVFNTDGRAIIEHCTIVGNSALVGDGIFSNGGASTSTEISASIIRDNFFSSDNPNGSDLAIQGGAANPFVFSGENLIGSVAGNITNITLNLDPILLGSLSDNGGPTQTMLPLAGSPALDAATSSLATVDQRGFPIVDIPDIGAAEAVSIVTTAVDELDAGRNEGTGLSLREALRDAKPNDLIFFAPELDGEIIALDAELGELLIAQSLTIDASALLKGIVIDGGSDGDFVKDEDETRCFLISDNDEGTQLEVSLNNLTIQKGVFEGRDAGANIHNRENLNLTNCQILDGRAFGFDADGGGVFNVDGNVTMTSCTVSGNQAQGSGADGGGVFNGDGNVTMTSCTVSGNQTQGGRADGGGVFSFFGSLTMTSCTVSGNQTQGGLASGGGIHCFRGNLTMTSCTVSGNQTQGSDADGGGIFTITNLTNETARLTRCTIAGNSALDADGGGVFNADGRAIIEHCTIVGNSTGSGNGAGISSDDDTSASTEISHSIVQDNLGGFDLDLQDSGAVNSFVLTGENLIGTVGTGIDGVTLNTAPILLAPFANYGGPTKTMPPLFGSPAINSATSSTSTEDQRGFLIIGTPDIGAAEFQDPDDLLSDNDSDGLVRILELAIGTDPDVADFTSDRRPSIGLDANGDIALSFGRGSEYIDGTILIVERSTTLEEGSFEEVYRFVFNSETSTIAPGSGIVEDVQADQFTITDETQTEDKVFYRLSVFLE